MDRACKNCRFCIYAHSRGKDTPYCERHSKWIGDTLLCSEWEAVIVPKPLTNADRIRSMTDEELAAWLSHHSMACVQGKRPCPEDCVGGCEQCWLDWLKQEAGE